MHLGHREPEVAALELAVVEDGDDAGVVEPRGELDLGEEAGALSGCVADVGAEHLHRDAALELAVVDAAHLAEAAAAEQPQILVARRQRRAAGAGDLGPLSPRGLRIGRLSRAAALGARRAIERHAGQDRASTGRSVLRLVALGAAFRHRSSSIASARLSRGRITRRRIGEDARWAMRNQQHR